MPMRTISLGSWSSSPNCRFQGIAVFDKDTHLICWNRQFGELLQLPNEMVRIGIDLAEILRFNADRGAFGPGHPETLVRERLPRYAADSQPFLERFPDRGLVIEVRVNPLPDGGVVTTLTDITPSVAAAQALSRANENLERRGAVDPPRGGDAPAQC